MFLLAIVEFIPSSMSNTLRRIRQQAIVTKGSVDFDWLNRTVYASRGYHGEKIKTCRLISYVLCAPWNNKVGQFCKR